MTSERMAIFGFGFPRGFQEIADAVRQSHDKLNGLPKSYFPRAPKDGEHLIRVDVDPNGVEQERGDILLSLKIKSAAFPGLSGDWEIVQAKPRFNRGSSDMPYRSRYLLVRPAKPTEAAKAREIKEAFGRVVMDRAMSS